ncbi:MAG TPA: hypothetical protein VGH82_01685 [Gaiellaceae bacterium]|jgi:hypothetical protein
MAKASARRKAGLGPPPSRKPAPPVRSKGSRAPRQLERRTWLIGGLVTVVVVLAIVLGIVLTGGGNKSAATSSKVIPWASIPGLQTGAPPWNNSSAVLPDRLQLLGLSALGQEGTAIHIHQHLNIYVNGKKVQVPALVGIDTTSGFLTELHTHDTTGVLHVESASKRDYVLGQFFGEWGVKLTPSCLGTYCGNLKWWVNGKRMVGNPAQLILKAHQEIVIATGKAPSPVPASYKFPAGL